MHTPAEGDSHEPRALNGLNEQMRALGHDNKILRRAISGANIGVVEYDDSQSLARWDGTVYHILGIDREVQASRTLAEELIHPEDCERYHAHMRAAMDPNGSKNYDFTYRIVRRDTGKTVFLSNIGRVDLNKKGEPYISGVIRDVTLENQVAQHLGDITLSYVERERRRYAATAAAEIGIWEFDVSRQTGYVDDIASRLFGWGKTSNTVSYSDMVSIIHPDDRQLCEDIVADAMRPDGGSEFQFNYRIRRGDTGVTRWIKAIGQCFFEGDMPAMIRGTLRDVTEEQQATEELELMNRELHHRVKNMFAAINAMIRISARGYPEVTEYAEKLSGRISTLSAAHLISMDRDSDAPIQLRRLVFTVLAPYASEKADMIRIKGEDLTLPREFVPSVGMILHELATNAVKYGGLSVDGRGLDVTIRSCADNASMELIWKEHCQLDPSDIESAVAGFGSRLVSMSAQQINVDYKPLWKEDGLEVCFKLRL